MTYDKSRVYTALNADELKVGSMETIVVIYVLMAVGKKTVFLNIGRKLNEL